MFESAGSTRELDAAVGVREAETGYRDRWRNWLTGGGGALGIRARRVLKTGKLLAGWMEGTLQSFNCQEMSRQVRMNWTPNKVTLLRVVVGFLAVIAFGHGAWMNLLGVALTVAAIALDALDGYIARRKKMATPVGAQLDILGDRVIENMFFTYFAVVGMVSLWLPMLFFARGAATDFLRGLAMKAGYSGWGANAMLQSGWAKALVASRWSRGLYAAMKCACFCYLGLELALTRGPVALLGPVSLDMYAAIRAGAQTLAWMTGVFCVVRGLPVLVEGWRFLASNLSAASTGEEARGDAG